MGVLTVVCIRSFLQHTYDRYFWSGIIPSGVCMRNIILATASQRRIEIFKITGLPFDVEASDYEEDFSLSSDPYDLLKIFSTGKAEAVARHHHDAIIIGGDMIIVSEGKIFGKPHTNERAREMLLQLSGKPHQAISGTTIIDTLSGKRVFRVVESRIFFKNLSVEEIDFYIRSGEPLDRAGAYAIQGLGALFVDRIEGDYFAILGLSLRSLSESLEEFGIRVLA